jgi:hypothetical protein
LLSKLLFIFLQVGCSALNPSSQPGFDAAITIDVFSGRTNPTWNLSSEEVKTLQEMLDSLSSAESTRPRPDRLGYRSIIVDLEKDNSTDRLFVYEGQVEWETTSGARFYSDPDRALERWLLSTGQRHIEPDLYETIEREIFKE